MCVYHWGDGHPHHADTSSALSPTLNQVRWEFHQSKSPVCHSAQPRKPRMLRNNLPTVQRGQMGRAAGLLRNCEPYSGNGWRDSREATHLQSSSWQEVLSAVIIARSRAFFCTQLPTLNCGENQAELTLMLVPTVVTNLSSEITLPYTHREGPDSHCLQMQIPAFSG